MILVTGVAGFIGYHLSKRLLLEGHHVLGVDNLNDYYSVQLKNDRLKQLETFPRFQFQHLELANRKVVDQLFESTSFDRVVHLAAQAGVRFSFENPASYIDSNLVAFANILEGCRHARTPHLVYASSSSVYGANTSQPFSIHQSVDHPVSLYAATKKANELLAHTYSHLFRLPTTGLRFFTVYGPWGRPDMALYKFTQAIFKGDPIDVYNHGRMRRDFTYVEDVVDALQRILDKIPEPNPGWSSDCPDPGTSNAPYRLFNIGNHQPTELGKFIEVLEQVIGITAIKNYLPMQPGDVLETYADVEDLRAAIGYAPTTPIEVGVAHFVNWYREYSGRGLL